MEYGIVKFPGLENLPLTFQTLPGFQLELSEAHTSRIKSKVMIFTTGEICFGNGAVRWEGPYTNQVISRARGPIFHSI